MTHPYAGDPNVYPATVTLVDDGDPGSAAVLNVPWAQLADRTAYLFANAGKWVAYPSAAHVNAFWSNSEWTAPGQTKPTPTSGSLNFDSGSAEAQAGDSIFLFLRAFTLFNSGPSSISGDDYFASIEFSVSIGGTWLGRIYNLAEMSGNGTSHTSRCASPGTLAIQVPSSIVTPGPLSVSFAAYQTYPSSVAAWDISVTGDFSFGILRPVV